MTSSVLNGHFVGDPGEHLPQVGDMFDFFIEKAYRFRKERRRDEPIFLITPDGKNRRGAKFRIACICYVDLSPNEPYEISADCTVVVQNGVIVHVSADYEHY